MATALEICNFAFRRLGIKAEDEDLTADQIAYGGDVLTGLFAEIENEYDVTWALSAVPDVSSVPLANLLAVEIAPAYGAPAPEPRSAAWRRFMATVRSDNRDDFRDLDDSGTIDTSEEAVGDAARYY